MAVKRCPRCGSSQVQFMNQDKKALMALLDVLDF